MPTEMNALVADTPGNGPLDAVKKLRFARIPVPVPRHGQVLVRIRAAPCNPADLLYIEGRYGIDRPLPATPGFEGAGEVVASGGGWIGRYMVGKRVAVGGHDCSGTWAEYCLTEANQCLPLRNDVSFELGATSVANPMTALALMSVVRKGRHRAYVQTAAASQLGRMLLAIGLEQGVPGIHVVRRQAQADALRQIGAEHVLVSTDPGFDDELRSRSQALGATIALDAVAGATTGRLVRALPKGSEVVLYGALDGEPCSGVDPMTLAFGAKQVRGFEVAAHLRRLGFLGTIRLARTAQARVADGRSKTLLRASFPLAEAHTALAGYVGAMSEGKVLLMP